MGQPTGKRSLLSEFFGSDLDQIEFVTLTEKLRGRSLSNFELESLFLDMVERDITIRESDIEEEISSLLNPSGNGNKNATGRTVQDFYDKIKNHDLLSGEEERELFQLKERYEQFLREVVLSTPFAVDRFAGKLETVRSEDRSVKNLLNISKVEQLAEGEEASLFNDLESVKSDLLDLRSELTGDSRNCPPGNNPGDPCIREQRHRILKLFSSIDVDDDLIEQWATTMRESPGRTDFSGPHWEAFVTLLNFLNFGRRYYRDRIAVRNLRLVFSLLDQFMNRGLTAGDLIQEGNMGLMKAIDKFDHEKGYKFSTYATWWIRQAMQRALHDQRSLIRLPSHRREELTKLFGAMSELKQDLHREPGADEVARKLNWAEEKVRKLLKINDQPLSLHEDNGQSDDRTLEDVTGDPASLDFADTLERNQVTERINELLGDLTWRKEQIVRMRYGLDQEKKQTFRTIAELMDLSKERVRQLEQDALDELREKVPAESVSELQ